MSDHGAAFGRMGRAGIISQRTKWRLEDYQSQKFIDRVTEAGLDLNFEGDAP